MSWGSILGGVAGFFVGGPLGAAAGAVIGAGLESLDEENVQQGGSLPNLQADLQFINDADGTFLVLNAPTVPNHAVIFVHARSGSGFIKTHVEAYADNDGDFTAVMYPHDGRAMLYLPKGIISPDYKGEINLSFRAFIVQEGADPIVLGETFFFFEHPTGMYQAVYKWRPLVYLCMYVAHADGKLDRSEVAAIKNILLQELEIPREEIDTIKSMMRSYAEWSLADCIGHLYRRIQGVDPVIVLQCLAQIAQADDVIDPKEVDMIHQVFLEFDFPEHEWVSMAESLGLISSSQHTSLDEYREVLGVDAHASAADIRRAYREKAAQYHPDKYHNLPPEFQEVAKNMMNKLSNAKDALLSVL